MQLNSIHQSIGPIIEPSVEAMGYRLVRIIWQGSEKRRILQIMIERLDGAEMTVDDCSETSHMVSALLDVKDPIDGAYELEVSSPGVDRPLMNEADFNDYVGHEVKVEMAIPQEGRRRFRSGIEQAKDGIVILVNGGERFELPLDEMASAKLVMTDELMEDMAQRMEQKSAEVENNANA